MNCPICDSPRIKYFHEKDGYKIYDCLNCSLLYVWPIPQNLNDTYSEKYFENNNLEDTLGYMDYNKRQIAMEKIFTKYLALMSNFSNAKSLLDIGAASGQFINIAKKNNWQAKGIDISDYAAKKAQASGLPVLAGDFLKISLSEKFDAITMWDVIEHVDDPSAYIEKISQHLNQNGIIALTTVDRNSFWARLMGPWWHLIIPPEHLYYFSKKSLSTLLMKNDFEILTTKKIGRRSYLPQILKTLYRWQGLKIWNFLYDFSSSNNFLKNIIIPINLRDNIFLIAKKKSKTAIFHNFMDNIGGAESVSLTLAQELKADLYTTNINQDKIKKLGFPQIKLKSIGSVPINAPFKQQSALWRFSQLNLHHKYPSTIISGDWAVSAAQHNHPNLWYVHSPIREIWDLYEYTRKNNVPKFGRLLFDIWVKYNRFLIKKYSKHVDKLVCNSINTQTRIKKYLNREALVIHPPINTAKFYYKKNGDFWLSVNRLISYKRIEMQLRAFAKLPHEKLIIVGSFEPSKHFKKYVDYLNTIKPANVEIWHWIDQSNLIELYSNCRGFLTTSLDEDFGMAAVEAMASGKAVIAPNEGGYRETIINGVTGLLLDNINEDKIMEAINTINVNPGKYKEVCLRQAKKFDTAIFIEKIKAQL